MHSNAAFDTSVTVTVESGEVMIDGPNGIAPSLTPRAEGQARAGWRAEGRSPGALIPAGAADRSPDDLAWAICRCTFPAMAPVVAMPN